MWLIVKNMITRAFFHILSKLLVVYYKWDANAYAGRMVYAKAFAAAFELGDLAAKEEAGLLRRALFRLRKANCLYDRVAGFACLVLVFWIACQVRNAIVLI